MAAPDWVANLADTVGGVSYDPIPAGGTIQYALRITNNGTTAAPATTVTIDVPANSQLTGISSALSNCVAIPQTGPGQVVCDVPALAVDEQISAVLTVIAGNAGNIVVGVSIPTTGDVSPTDNTTTQRTTIQRGADLSLAIAAPSSAAAGAEIQLGFVVTNNGPDSVDSLTVEVPMPTGLTGIVPPSNCTLTGSSYLCTVSGPIASGSSTTLNFAATVSSASASTITVVGSVQGVSPRDPHSNNNTVTANITTTPGSDLAIAKSRSPSGSPLVGDTVTFTLLPSYTGDSANNITVIDNVPAGYTIQSVSGAAGAGWTCSVTGQQVSCLRVSGPVATGAGISLGNITIVTLATTPGAAQNTATISSSSSYDPNTSNNTATDGGTTILEPTIDLRAQKSGPSPALAVVGNPYNFRISTTNIGSTGYYGKVVLTDSLPAGLTYTGVTAPSGWSCLPAAPPNIDGPVSITCTSDYTQASPLAANATTPAITIHTLANAAGTLSNRVDVSAVNGNLPDLNSPNNTAYYTVGSGAGPNSADISLRKTVSGSPVAAGENVTFAIEVVNAGPQTAANVDMLDDLTGLINGTDAIVSIASAGGSASGLSCASNSTGGTSARLSCTIATLPVCVQGSTCPVITVVATVGGTGGDRTNEASAISSETPDPNLDNNSDSVDYTVVSRADVMLTKSGAPSPAVAGQDLRWVLTATNVLNALSAAENVTITDTLPADVTFVSAVASSGSCSVTPTAGSTTGSGNNQVICNLGTVNNGSQQTVTVTVRPNTATRGTTLVNTATVATSTTETNTDNNAASNSIPVQDPYLDLQVNKTEDVDPLTVDDQVVYTITAMNNGPSDAENVVVRDVMPAGGINFVSVTASSGGTCTTLAVGTFGGTLSCTFPRLASGQSAQVFLTALGRVKGVYTNHASVESTETLGGFDTNDENNAVDEATTLRTRADLLVKSKVATPSTVNLNDDFVFTIIVENRDGFDASGKPLSEADEVVVTDTLPAGMYLRGAPTYTMLTGSAVGGTGCTGVDGGTSFSCAFGTVSKGAQISITVPVEVLQAGANPTTLTNSAKVTTFSYDPDTSNDTNSGNVMIGTSTLTGTVWRDFNALGTRDLPGDTGVSGVGLTLTGTTFDNRSVTLSTTTASDGTYSFANIPQGTYTVTRTSGTTSLMREGRSFAGSVGGSTALNSAISTIPLPAATTVTAYDFSLIPIPSIGLAKAVSGTVSTAADGSFMVTFNFLARNYSQEAVSGITVTDTLTGTSPLFGTLVTPGNPTTDTMANGTYAIVTRTGAPASGCPVLSTFDGSGNTALMSAGSLAAGGACTIAVRIRVMPTSPLPPILTGSVRYRNSATVTGTGVLSGLGPGSPNAYLTDVSDNGTNPDSNNNSIANDSSESDPTPVSPTFTTAIQMRKTAVLARGTAPAQPGDLVTYSFLVRNTGNVTLRNVVITDARIQSWLDANPIATLAPGEASQVTVRGTYALTQADIDSGSITNQATVAGTDPFGRTATDTSGTELTNNTATLTEIPRTLAIAVTKAADASDVNSPAEIGDEITYSFDIRNSGTVTLYNVTLADPKFGATLTLVGAAIAQLDPGQTVAARYRATYPVTQGDIDQEQVTNQATVSAKGPQDQNVSDLSGATFADNNPTVVPLDVDASIAIIKTLVASSVPAVPQAENVLSYTFVVRNTGTVTLNNVTVDELLTGAIVSGPAVTLSPGEESSAFTATYALTQADIDAGTLANRAEATGTTTRGAEVTDQSGADFTTNADTIATLAHAPDIALRKWVASTALSTPPAAGDTVTYRFEVRNTGNVTLTGVGITDSLAGGALAGGPVTLAPGQSDTTTFTYVHALTQAEIDVGEVENSAIAAGTAPGSVVVTDRSGTTLGDDDPTTQPITRSPAIALVKVLSGTAPTAPEAEDLLTWQFTVRNTGNVTLTTVDVEELLIGSNVIGGPVTDLAPGDESTAFTATYALTQADIDAGSLTNRARANGTTASAGDVSDLSGANFTSNSDTVVLLPEAPAIALVKTADASALSNPPAVEDVISYSFVVHNTGNVTLHDVVVTDPLTGLDNSASPIATLEPKASTTLYDSYELIQADLDNGFVQNTAVATGQSPVGTGVTDNSGTSIPGNDPTVVGLSQDPGIRLVKTVNASALSTPPKAGETLSYAFTVTNFGNVTLTNVIVTDPMLGTAGIAGSPIASLPAHSSATTVTGTYTLTQDDIDLGRVENTATVTGTPPTGPDVTDVSGTAVDNDTPTGQLLTRAPSIAVIKTIAAASLSTPAVPGDTVDYAFTITNTGNVRLTGLQLSDILPDIQISGTPPASLDPGDSTTVFTAHYVVKQSDIDAGEVRNSATARGTAPDSTVVEDTSGATASDDLPTVLPIGRAPGIAVVKQITGTSLSTPPVPGDTIRYGFTVTNTGNVTLTGLGLSDVLAGIQISGTAPASLAPGASTSVFTGVYALTQADIDAGEVVNSATAAGTAPDGTTVTDTSGSTLTDDQPTVQPIGRAPAIAVVKTITGTAFSTPPLPGEVISYGFAITNTGNVTLTGLQLTDALPGIVITGTAPANLAPGATTTAFTASYALTQADIDAGQVVNSAVASGAGPDGTVVNDTSGATVADDTATVQPVLRQPALTLVKTADVSGFADGAFAGDILPYSFTVTNTGNVVLTDVTISDPLPGVVVTGGPVTLQPGESDSTSFTARYPLQEADITRAQVDNTATASGNSVAGPASATGSTTAFIGNIEAAPETFPPFDTDGGTTSSMLASDRLNGGAATLADVTIRVIETDDGLMLDPATGLITLEPGRPSGVYQVTYEVCSITIPTLCSQAVETVVQMPLPELTVIKTAVVEDNGDGLQGVGDTIRYTITVTNTGNVVMTDIRVSDRMTNLSGTAVALATGPDFVSASAGSSSGNLQIDETARYTASYIISEADVMAGGVSNSAVAEGSYVVPPGVPAEPGTADGTSSSGSGAEPGDPTVTPLTPVAIDGVLSVEKSTPRGTVQRGATVPYTITITNTSSVAARADLVDSLPSGFLYVVESARLDGVPATVTVTGRIVTWKDITVPPDGQVVATLSARVPTGVNPGEYVNRATVRHPESGTRLAPEARATVRIMAEPVFDCGDVIGKVFDDSNADGYQNQGEAGIPAVRLAGVDGTIISTDKFGRYHVPCAMLPEDRGSNFILKLDTRSLPAGYRVTTDNPRTVRLTPGKMSELNFGAAISRVVRLDITARAFADGADGKPAVSARLGEGIDRLIRSLAGEPVTLRIAFHLGEGAGQAETDRARALVKVAETYIRQKWREFGRVKLTVEHTLVRE